ncbi:MAG: hypothetical protein IJX62_06980 [Clostridia bacterium]|nr:hypothetical protein [Clostridia bacterium]
MEIFAMVFGGIVLMIPIVFLALHFGIHAYSKVEDRRIKKSTKQDAFAPDLYAEKHNERVMAGMKDEAALEQRWMKEIAPLLPTNVAGNGIALWTARLFFFSVSLPSEMKGNARDAEYHISHSSYAILDFAIYSFFEIRRTLVSCLRRRVVEKIEDAYFAYLVKYFFKYFSFTEEEVNRIIDNRLEQYEKVIQMRQIDVDEEMLMSACDFMIRDFHNEPMQAQTIVIPASKQILLRSELAALMHAEYNLLKKLQNGLPSDCFLD